MLNVVAFFTVDVYISLGEKEHAEILNAKTGSGRVSSNVHISAQNLIVGFTLSPRLHALPALVRASTLSFNPGKFVAALLPAEEPSRGQRLPIGRPRIRPGAWRPRPSSSMAFRPRSTTRRHEGIAKTEIALLIV